MSEKTQSATDSRPRITEQEIADYLLRHPDFFHRHDYLLPELTVPHAGAGSAVSLVERQLAMLRGQERELKRKLQDLARTALANETLLERLGGLILALIDSTTLAQAVEQVQGALRENFHADAVTLRLFEGPATREEVVARDDAGLALVEGLLNERQPVCGHLSPEQRHYLFGQQAGELASAVLIPLCEPDLSDCLGLLAVGSADARRYHPEMGTVFVGHLGAVLCRVLRSHLRHGRIDG